MKNVLVPKDQLAALLTPMVAIQRGYASRKQREHKLRVARMHQFDDFLASLTSGLSWKDPCTCGRNHKSLVLKNGTVTTICPVVFYLSMHNIVRYKIGDWTKWLEWMSSHPITELLKPLVEGKDACYIDIPPPVLFSTPEELKCLRLQQPTLPA